MTRKLTAILYADTVGYSRLTGIDEEGAHRTVMGLLDLVHATVESEGGRVLRHAGDAILAEFTSIVSCVKAAVVAQEEIAERNERVPEDSRALFRMGINLGEVIEDRGEIYGDGVNVAARLESLAPPGGICITGQVADQIAGKTDAVFGDAGRHAFKNIAKPIEVWCWPAESARALRRRSLFPLRAILTGAVAAIAIIAVGYFLALEDEKPELPSGSRIAVIPFEEVGSSPDETYFSDGLTKDINAHLSTFTNLFVFSPGSVTEYRGNVDCEKIREGLEADFILEGSVRRSKDRFRITTTLTDAKTCRQLDSPGPYDRDLEVIAISKPPTYWAFSSRSRRK